MGTKSLGGGIHDDALVSCHCMLGHLEMIDLLPCSSLWKELLDTSDFSVVTLLSFCRLVCMAEKVCFLFFFKLHTSYAKVKVQPKPDPLLSPPRQACKVTAVPQWVPHILYFQVGFRHLKFLVSETLWYLTSILLHTEPLSFSNRDKQWRKVFEKAMWIFCLT